MGKMGGGCGVQKGGGGQQNCARGATKSEVQYRPWLGWRGSRSEAGWWTKKARNCSAGGGQGAARWVVAFTIRPTGACWRRREGTEGRPVAPHVRGHTEECNQTEMRPASCRIVRRLGSHGEWLETSASPWPLLATERAQHAPSTRHHTLLSQHSQPPPCHAEVRNQVRQPALQMPAAGGSPHAARLHDEPKVAGAWGGFLCCNQALLPLRCILAACVRHDSAAGAGAVNVF